MLVIHPLTRLVPVLSILLTRKTCLRNDILMLTNSDGHQLLKK
jgi:hypothetical protein